MVSMTKLATVHGSDASRHRLKKRRAAETRLRLYGILAILLSGIALVALLYSVIGKAAGAMTEHYITLPVMLDGAEIDPDGTGDPKIIGKANFGGLTKDVLKDAFPTVKDRKAKRRLYDLVSSGAAFELRQLVLDNPGLIGTKIDFAFLASDVTDLYLKGSYGDLLPVDHAGNLTIVSDKKTVSVTSTANDFSAALAEVKRNLLNEAARVHGQAALQDNGVRVFTERLAAATDEETKAALRAEVDTRSAKRDALNTEADALTARARSEGGVEKLSSRDRSVLLKVGSGWLQLTEVGLNTATGKPIVDSGAETEFFAADWSLFFTEGTAASRKVSDDQIVWLEQLRETGKIEQRFSSRFFTAGDSREPELAGIWSATVGSFWTMLVTFVLAFPIGVLTAIYLEEFAPRNRFTDIIEVNINNLAAVPSIIFGLLGLSVIIGFFGVPRSAPLAGGIVLALMTLPTIIIAARASIAAVPPSIREAAFGIGASQLQVAFHHVLPLSMPGILTGTIIGMARALGETAPLIMIGMVAFIVDVPQGITDSSSVLPVQVFRWADFPERAFEARTAAAICVLLAFLIAMNALAVFLRKRFERRW